MLKHRAHSLLTLLLSALLFSVSLPGCAEVADEEAPGVDYAPEAEDYDTTEVAVDSRPRAVEIAGPTIQGGLFALSDHQDAVVALNFFATWCGPCVAEIPDLKALDEEFGDELVIVGVSLDDSAAGLPGFVARHGIDYPVLHLDALNNPEAVLNGYVFQVVPTTFVIAPQGRIGEVIIGSRSQETFRQIFSNHIQ